MLKKSKKIDITSKLYTNIYLFFVTIELIYGFLILSPHGKLNGMFNGFYIKIKNNLNYFLIFGFLFSIFFNYIFPGIGWISFIITLYKIADLCCYQKEMFETDVYYGSGKYNHAYSTIYNEAILERINDGTRSGTSSSKCDIEDNEWLSKLCPNDNKKPFLCDDGCNKCNVIKYGKNFEILNKPRGIYSTSLLAKEMRLS